MATVRLDGSTSVAVSTVGSSSRRLGRRRDAGFGHSCRPAHLLDLGYLSHLVAIGVVAIALRCKFGVTTKKDECVACMLVCWCDCYVQWSLHCCHLSGFVLPVPLQFKLC